ncbi:hypothetical protein HYPBUDRAFT_114611 [Hyphopichia burtonii NRRL Y-1933]|uniref:Phospholipid/glycerol acyltransferase domain-containing protein n=1 Tax=Hyphopichia burtonii NRRL Y-1933 TaxID=984485 RepID=A0A1E4RCN6_9ASCO|nr:hypothetical protein HYPBUDRAFT_114611 [Hyphopichia burtonii NRRL Y-1933]ODV65029.1 hypothetical protein HYPBUDRAFT_114611 [Hyphopichia burtonii NRRL Y-1933]
MPPQLTQIHKSSFLGEILRIIAYDLVLWFFNLVLHTFFRDIKSRGTFNIPKQGPIVFVIAPHHNQFVDPLVVMSIVREYSNRRISFLVAAKSYRRKFIGTMSKWCSAIPVERAQDLLKPVPGKIFIKNLYPKDENDDCNLIVEGKDTFFTKNCMEKGLIGLPDSLGNAQVEKVFSDTKLKLRKPFDIKLKDSKVIELLTNGTEFRLAPHIDNNVVFQNVFDHLNAGKVLGMFPEGGSHDRPDLLPLKPGVAIMALGAAAKSSDPNQMINVIPVGMNYFHPHKFRSRVVIEFGKAIKVSKEDGLKYQEDSRTQVGRLLDLITLRLREVTVLCDDYDTLMALQAARRLYTLSKRELIPLPLVVEMNRRLIKGYQKYSKNPDVIEMKKLVSEYNKNLMRLGLHDHQVEKITSSDRFENFIIFSNRLFKVVLFFILSLPGALMFLPVFIISRKISKQKAKEALEGSVVKIKAKDVLGSWKIMVALGIAPMLYIFWSICGVLIIKHNFNTNINGWLLFIIFYCWSVLTTYASLRIGEIGVDYYKSLKPLVYSLLSHHLDVKQIEDLKKNRQILSNKVTKFCNKYGPGIFEDFDNFYKRYNNIEDADFKIEESSEDEIPSTRPKFDKNLSKTESFNLNNLSDIPIFSNANFLDPFTNHEEEDDEEGEEEQSHEHESESESEIEDIDKPNENASIKLRNAMMKRRS